MPHPAIKCQRCGLRIEDSGEAVQSREIGDRSVRFVGDEEVCSCGLKLQRRINAFTSRPQPANLDTYDRKRY